AATDLAAHGLKLRAALELAALLVLMQEAVDSVVHLVLDLGQSELKVELVLEVAQVVAEVAVLATTLHRLGPIDAEPDPADSLAALRSDLGVVVDHLLGNHRVTDVILVE